MNTFPLLIVSTILGSILAFEARAWLPYLSRWLVAQAIRRFPKDLEVQLRERWGEEIEADLAAFEDRPVGGLLFALRVRLKGGRDLAAELALQQALQANKTVSEDEDESENEIEVATAQPAFEFDFEGRSLQVLMHSLEAFLKDIVSLAPSARDVPLENLRTLLRHRYFRKALNRFDPDLRTVEGMKIALLLQDLRREVEGWDSHE